MCDTYIAIRTGTDIAFLRRGHQLHHYVNDKWFKEFVLAYTNASTIVDEGFKDTEDLDGLFSGYDEKTESYNPSKGHWGYKKPPVWAVLDGVSGSNAGGETKTAPDSRACTAPG